MPFDAMHAMRDGLRAAAVLAALIATPAAAQEAPAAEAKPAAAPAAAPTAEVAAAVDGAKAIAGAAAFVQVHRVLLSPRCMNCHPTGDRPLQGDDSHLHRMNISRRSEKNGVACATCHQTRNSEALGIAGGPPGAPNWHLPPEDMPMVFQGKSPAELCAQLKDPARNGGKSLAELLHHVAEDPLVLWGWQPGGDRTLPPLPHAEFVAAFETWVKSGAACPQ